MQKLSSHACHSGILGYYSHASSSNKGDMRLTVYMPPKPTGAALIFLSGLTCTEENFTTKAGAYAKAAELGLIIIAPDTSPRGNDVPDDESIALGKGAGFYLDATQAPWNVNYNMYTYITVELPALLKEHFPIKVFGLFGHSMGGHGALVIGQRNPDLFRSISAFAPVSQPSVDGWGPAAFTAYLGTDKQTWLDYDATALMASRKNAKPLPEILIDQGRDDSVYKEGRLNPEAFQTACASVDQPVNLRFHPGYDHGYFFIQTFINDHLDHHARLLAEIK